MFISRIHLENFRSYQKCTIDFPPQGALITGANGSGKTNLLESIFLLCTGRSQRGASRSDFIRFGSDVCFAEGLFRGKAESGDTTVSFGLSRDNRVSMRINDQSIASFSQWFGHSIAVSFSPDDLKLVQGSPRERRAFLDLVISQIDPSYLDALIAYKKNLANRNNLLTRHISDMQLEVFEENMVNYGAVIYAKRQEVLAVLAPVFSDFYREISNSNEAATLAYHPQIRCDSATVTEWKDVFFKGLKSAKNRDIGTGFSSIGPHRDDVALFVNSKDARTYASMGQCTTVFLSLRMASVLVYERYTNDTMIFLFDDAVSYLDTMRTSRVFPLLSDRGQILITAPLNRQPGIAGLARFSVQDGMVTPL